METIKQNNGRMNSNLNTNLKFDSTPIPDRMFFKIGEVAEITNLKPYVLRFWETEFKELAPTKANNNQRKYTREKIETLLLIKKLLYEEKYTIEGAKQKIKEVKIQKSLSVNNSKEGQILHKKDIEYIKERLKKIRKEISQYSKILNNNGA